jgi:lipopolysaccharide export system permease protein
VVDLNGKLSFPLLSFVMVLIGIPIALGLKKGGTPLAVSLGIAACFLYLLMHGLARSFGCAGVLPPIFSAWLASLAFLLFGIYLMIRVET